MGDDRAGQELTSTPRASSSAPPEWRLARSGTQRRCWRGARTSLQVVFASGTMATDSWALAVDEQEAAVKSVSGLAGTGLRRTLFPARPGT